MIVVAGAAALVIAAIAVLAFGTWWALAIALAAHALGTLIVVGYALQRANQDGGKPDPMAEARIEERRASSRNGAARPARSTPPRTTKSSKEESMAAPERGGGIGGVSLGGILVIVGILVAVLWSLVLGVIIALVGLIAFGGFARGRWY